MGESLAKLILCESRGTLPPIMQHSPSGACEARESWKHTADPVKLCLEQYLVRSSANEGQMEWSSDRTTERQNDRTTLAHPGADSTSLGNNKEIQGQRKDIQGVQHNENVVYEDSPAMARYPTDTCRAEPRNSPTSNVHGSG